MSGCVYIATCTINNKKYVGKTMHSLQQRKTAHESMARGMKTKKYAFQCAINKYGEDSFIWESVFESDNENELFAKEIELIKELNTVVPNGYNLSGGGEGVLFTDAVYKNYKESRKKLQENPEYRKHLAEANARKVADPIVRQKISLSVSRYYLDVSKRQEMSAKIKELHKNKEFRERYLNGVKNRNMDYLPSLASKNRKRLAKKIKCITTGEIFDAMIDAKHKLGCNPKNICGVCKGYRKSVGGYNGIKYVFEYIDEGGK